MAFSSAPSQSRLMFSQQTKSQTVEFSHFGNATPFGKVLENKDRVLKCHKAYHIACSAIVSLSSVVFSLLHCDASREAFNCHVLIISH